jgi:hypothetical protein
MLHNKLISLMKDGKMDLPAMKIVQREILQDGGIVKDLTTFPAQALPCSGSTGIISAIPHAAGEHPEESENVPGRDESAGNDAKIGRLQENCNFCPVRAF